MRQRPHEKGGCEMKKESKKPEAKIVRIADYRARLAKKNIIRLEDVKLKPIAWTGTDKTTDRNPVPDIIKSQRDEADASKRKERKIENEKRNVFPSFCENLSKTCCPKMV